MFKVEVPGLQSTSVNYHRHDYLVVSLGKSNFEIAGSGIRYPMQMEGGEMQVIKGGASHRITNLSDSPLQLVEMEVMREIHPERPVCGLGGRACSDGIFGRNEDGSYSQSTLFETDTIKLARVQLGPRGLLPEHHHDRCHILVSLAQTALLDSASHARSRELHHNAGDAAWYSEHIAHTLNRQRSKSHKPAQHASNNPAGCCPGCGPFRCFRVLLCRKILGTFIFCKEHRNICVPEALGAQRVHREFSIFSRMVNSKCRCILSRHKHPSWVRFGCTSGGRDGLPSCVIQAESSRLRRRRGGEKAAA